MASSTVYRKRLFGNGWDTITYKENHATATDGQQPDHRHIPAPTQPDMNRSTPNIKTPSPAPSIKSERLPRDFFTPDPPTPAARSHRHRQQRWEPDIQTAVLDHLKRQIASPGGKEIDFSIASNPLKQIPTEATYRAAVLYAHARYLTVYDYCTYIYDRIDYLRLRAAQNMWGEDAKVTLCERIPRADSETDPKWFLNLDCESWPRTAVKADLQAEIRKAVKARRLMEVERERLYFWWEDASRRERESRRVVGPPDAGGDPVVVDGN
jgi:hypothetical protein